MSDTDFDLIGLESYYTGLHMTLKVHGSWQCAERGIPCCIHTPSNHPLQGAPMVWDGLDYRMYRKCEHDKLHPDPDHLAYVESVQRGSSSTVSVDSVVENKTMDLQRAHDCDECCI